MSWPRRRAVGDRVIPTRHVAATPVPGVRPPAIGGWRGSCSTCRRGRPQPRPPTRGATSMTRHIIAVCGAMALAGLTASAQIASTACLTVIDVGRDRSRPRAVSRVGRDGRHGADPTWRHRRRSRRARASTSWPTSRARSDGTTFVLERRARRQPAGARQSHRRGDRPHPRRGGQLQGAGRGGRDIDALATFAVSSVKSVASSCR